MGPNWAESWGEGDLESVEAGDLKDSAFASEEEGVERFTLLINHPTLDDSSPIWQQAVTDALADFIEMEDVAIEYSWDTTGDKRDKFIVEDEDGNFVKTTDIPKAPETRGIADALADSKSVSVPFVESEKQKARKKKGIKRI